MRTQHKTANASSRWRDSPFRIDGEQSLLLSNGCARDALQRLVDQVLQLAVTPVHSYSRKAATARQLAGITSAAVERYAAHLHAAASQLLRVSQVVLAPSSVVQSGKTTRHRRGESVGSPAASRCGTGSGRAGNSGVECMAKRHAHLQWCLPVDSVPLQTMPAMALLLI
jgi:hypothetical protein